MTAVPSSNLPAGPHLALVPTPAEQAARFHTMKREDQLRHVAKVLGMLTLDEVPRPGVAAPWGPKEWKNWLINEGGFQEPGRTTHSHIYHHAVMPEVICGVPTSTGDFRSSMAGAKDLRRQFLKPYEIGAKILGAAYRGDPATPLIVERWNATPADKRGTWLATAIWDKNITDELAKLGEQASNPDSIIELTKITNTAQKEFGVAARPFLKAAWIGVDTVEAITSKIEAFLLKSGNIPSHWLSLASEYLHDLRDNDRVATEQRRAEREAETRQREAEKALKAQTVAKPIPLTPSQSHAAAMDAIRQDFGAELSNLNNLAQALIGKVASVQTRLAQTAFPAPPTAELEAKVAETTKRALDAEALVSSAVLERDALRERVEELSKTPKHLDMLPEYEELVGRLVKLLSPSSFTELLPNIDKAKAELVAAQELGRHERSQRPVA